MFRSLPKTRYTNSKVFRNELDFFSKLSFVGHQSELKSKTALPKKMGRENIILTENDAFYNVCPHRGTTLLEIPTVRKLITCPYHSWSFTLDGQAKKAPMKTCLQKINTISPHGFKIVGDTHAYPWNGAWKGIRKMDWKSLEVTGQKTWHAKANWKLLIENFLEWYHLPSIHPALTKISGPGEHSYGHADAWSIGFKTDPITEAGTVADPSFKPHIPGAHPTAAHFHYLFPNLFWFVMPTHVFMVTLTPVTPEKTIENALLLTHPNSKWTSDELKELWSFYENVNQEDIDICERMQRGIKSSGFHQGWIEPKTEKNLVEFHTQLDFHLEHI
jgi:phenylpropionate dioxygenase-like ring-hydroxylating dioxygenase large terminal subunit